LQPLEHATRAGLLEHILAAQQANPGALERELGQRVHRLHGLTPDEIKPVEEASK
jgi:hypothetical protein